MSNFALLTYKDNKFGRFHLGASWDMCKHYKYAKKSGLKKINQFHIIRSYIMALIDG